MIKSFSILLHSLVFIIFTAKKACYMVVADIERRIKTSRSNLLISESNVSYILSDIFQYNFIYFLIIRSQELYHFKKVTFISKSHSYIMSSKNISLKNVNHLTTSIEVLRRNRLLKICCKVCVRQH